MPTLSRGFGRRARGRNDDDRLPPGQYDVGAEFPVLSAGATPSSPLDRWDLTVGDGTGDRGRWSWEDFRSLPRAPPFRAAVVGPCPSAGAGCRMTVTTGDGARTSTPSRERR